MCSDKNCTVGQYSTYDHVQGMLAELKARQRGLGSRATVHLRKLGGTHTLIENCLKDGQRYCSMYS